MLKTLRSTLAIGAVALTASFTTPSTADAQEMYIGQIFMGGWNFCPRGSLSMDGQLLSISGNEALFSLLGTSFGGDGRTTFGLPDMRGRMALHAGSGPGLTPRQIGGQGGSESNTLTTNQLPAHSHALVGTSTAANSPSPAGALPATTGRDSSYATGTADAVMGSGAVGNTGAGQAVNNMSPFTTLKWCIVQFGIFPPRN